MKWIKAISLSIACTVFMSACSGGSENNEEENIEVEIEDETEDEVGEEQSYLYTYPLTGMGTDEEVDRRVIGATINNHPAARPQSGIGQADIIYEILTEGEMTRFVALFHSELPERIGPIRSARPYLLDIVKGYNGVYVAHGWSPEAEKMLKNGYIDHINGLFYDGTLFNRSTDRKAPHNSYITYENVIEGIETLGYEDKDSLQTALSFYEEDEEQLEGESGQEVEISYYHQNNVRYSYDTKSRLYERYNGDEQTIDYETDEPLYIANVFIIEADHQILDDVGRRAVNLTSGGEAILFQNGMAIEAQWKNENGQIIPTVDGEVISLKPGQTWINVVPASPGLETSVTY